MTGPSGEGALRPPRWREIFADGRMPLTIGLILVELLAGLQSLVVTATMPQVLADVGGLTFYGWVFSGYSLAGLAAMPRAGRNGDLHGPRRPFIEGMAMFGAGSILCGLAPSMFVLAVVRAIQGYGGATLYTVAYGAVAKAYPDRLRARVVALLTLVWVASGLVGPAYGAALAATVGWRWSFLSVIPLVVLAWALTARPLQSLGGSPTTVARIEQRWPVQLALGTGLGLAGLSAQTLVVAIPLLSVGLAVAGQAVVHVLPLGTFRLCPGLPATVGAAFLLNLGFFAADTFVPLMLTGVRGTSVLEASVAVTLVTLGWSAGGWWQSRVMTRDRVAQLVRGGGLLLAAGITGTAAALTGLPLPLVYAAWVVAGVGMGISFSTVFLAALDSAVPGQETSVVAARFVGGRLGIALGSGLGGACVAIAAGLRLSLAAALWAVFGMAIASTVAGALTAGRLAPRAGER